MSPFVCLQGELKLTTIQKNVKQSIKDEFSLFCLGIGFDVDYDFLQRIATDNRGMAQRIFGNQETSAQMKVRFWPVASETARVCSAVELGNSTSKRRVTLGSWGGHKNHGFFWKVLQDAICTLYNSCFTALCRMNIP